jgi:hypothetical protein
MRASRAVRNPPAAWFMQIARLILVVDASTLWRKRRNFEDG